MSILHPPSADALFVKNVVAGFGLSIVRFIFVFVGSRDIILRRTGADCATSFAVVVVAIVGPVLAPRSPVANLEVA